MAVQTTNPYLEGAFAPVEEEVTVADLAVVGTLPPELDGRYLRIGPNPMRQNVPDPARHHWFVGDGMVHGVRLRDGRAEWYRNRWVRSTRVSEALGEPPAPGERHGGMDTVNTHVIGHAGRTFALVEAGARPVELTDELETICHTDLDGTLPNGYTAHPKRDPETGELFAMAYHWALPHLQYIVIGTDGRVRKVEPIPVDDGPMVHDMSLTERFAVVYDMPITFSLDLAAEGAVPLRVERRPPRPPRRAAPRGHRGRPPVVRRRPLLRVPPAQRPRGARRRRRGSHRPPRRAPPPHLRDRPHRPGVRGDDAPDAVALDPRPRHRPHHRGAARRPGPGVPARRREPGRPPGPLRLGRRAGRRSARGRARRRTSSATTSPPAPSTSTRRATAATSARRSPSHARAATPSATTTPG